MDGFGVREAAVGWLSSVLRTKAESGLYTVQLARGADRKWDLALEKSDVDAQGRRDCNWRPL